MAEGASGGTSIPMTRMLNSQASEQQRSLRALRRLLIAFRSAAHMNEEEQALAWTIDSSSGKLQVFCKAAAI